MFISNNAESKLGFSLVELLLSIALTILLTDLLIHVCVMLIKQQISLREKIVLEENVQLAEFILRREIQTAGFFGCNRLNQLNIRYHLTRPYLPIIPLQIFPKNVSIMGKVIHSESDIIVIEKMFEKTSGFLDQPRPKVIRADLRDRFESDEPLIIADCKQADVLVPSTIQYKNSFQAITATKSLNRYHGDADVGKLVATAFFIEKTQRKNRRGKAISALYSYDFVQHHKTEWVPGVEAMEFFYATRDSDDNNITFQPLSKSTDLSTIRLIKIVLFVRGEDSLIGSTETPYKKQEVLIYLRELS